MTKKKEIPRDTFITAATGMLNGKSIRSITREFNMSERDARWLSRNQGLVAEEFRELVIAKSQILIEELLGMIRQKMNQIPAAQLAVTYGILTDKMEMNNPYTHSLSIKQELKLQVGEETWSREEAIKLLTKPMIKNTRSRNGE